VELLTGELNLLLQESGWEYVLCPNIFETFSHVINAVMDAIEGVRVALGPTDQLSYCLQGPLHPVRTGREVYWKIYNSLSRTSPKGCPKHQGHKGDPGVTPGTCGAGGEKAQVILVWVRAPGVGNASHPWRLGVMRERP
jgi:hypothetical protein